ncbi:hypothetical protein ACFC3F_00405 [Microbacterium sp. NPDC055910]|uniref:hypothetical protein n=1 Tax=Microbacterium sp. NPDC055910 TaxID=3345659 RepID=UPI0035D802EC
MSNRRKPRDAGYQRDYLRSRAWFARRDRWFTDRLRSTGELACAACGGVASKRELELHHVDYAGVTIQNGRWVAAERDEDLVALHRGCHELLHRLIDRDPVLSRHRTRRDATALALTALRSKLQRYGEGVVS